MLSPLLEGVRSVGQPCTFLLVVPILAAVVAAGARWLHVAVALAAGVLGGWSLAGSWWYLDGAALRWSGLAAAIAVGVVVLQRRRRTPEGDTRRSTIGSAAVVAGVTVAASGWWRPCVGDELGGILTGAQSDLAGQLLPMAAYTVGVLVPVVAVGAIRELVPDRDRLWSIAELGAAAVAGVVGVALVAGRHEDVVIALTRWTQG